MSDGKNVIQSGAKTYARTALFYTYRAPAAVRLENNNYKFCAFFYDETGNISSGRGYIGNSGYVINEFVYINSTASLFGVVFTRNDGVELTSQDAETILNDLRCYGHTDNTLTLSDIPADAKATGEKITEAITEAFDAFIEEIPHPFLHMRPRTIGAYNAVRRARQLSDLRWTPAEDNKIRREYYIPANSYEETREHGFRDDSNFFEASKEYIGAPYSNRTEKRIGTNIGLETFVTSSAMKKSVMLTESESVRDWGSTYYGTTCSNLVSYALSMPPISTDNMVWYDGNNVKQMMPGLSFIHDIMVNGEPQDMSDAEIADILWAPGHCAMITDIVKRDGVVTDIEVTESSMTYLGIARRWMWKIDDFYRWFSVFGVYRYSDDALSKIEYFPNICAPMPDEGKRFVYINKQIMPYLGNKCIIYADNTASVRLIVCNVEDNLGAPVYTHILVRKNGEQYGTPIAIDLTKGTEPYYVDISLDVDEAIYTAMLCNYESEVISKYTAECEWIVTPVHTPQITFGADNILEITVNFKNSFFKPSYFIASITTGINYRNAIHISPDMLTEITESDGSKTYTITRAYDSYRDLKRILVGYASPYHGVIIETYSV